MRRGYKQKSVKPVLGTSIPLDFKPKLQLERALRGRAPERGMTFDPPGTYMHDDAEFIKRHDQGWSVEVSAADVPSMIPPESTLKSIARRRSEDQKIDDKTVRIFPDGFLRDFVSLAEGRARPAITCKIILDQHMKVMRTKIISTAFTNTKAHHDGSFSMHSDFSPQQAGAWGQLAQGLYQKRIRTLAAHYDRQIDPDAPVLTGTANHARGGMRDGQLLVHELTRLANEVMTDFVVNHDLVVPLRRMNAIINTVMVSENYDFDRACNRLCVDLVKKMQAEAKPYIHATSPMRKYSDFLTLEIIGNHMRGFPPDPKLRDEVDYLSAQFNGPANGGLTYLNRDDWRAEWKGRLANQRQDHPFAWNDAHSRRQPATARMDWFCREYNLGWPQIVIRQFMVQGAEIYFAGINSRRPNSNRDIQGWAVSHDPVQAVNTACERVLKTLDMTRPGIRPQSSFVAD